MTPMWEGLALRPPTVSWPYVGEVFRSLVGVLLAALAAWHWAPIGVAGMAVAAVGGAAVAGAVALHDSPHARVPLVIGVALGIGMTVLIGALTSASNPAFLIVVVAACLSAGNAANHGAEITRQTEVLERTALSAARKASRGALTSPRPPAPGPRRRPGRPAPSPCPPAPGPRG